MPIIRITKKQLEEANKAREDALKKDATFRAFEDHKKRLEMEMIEKLKKEKES